MDEDDALSEDVRKKFGSSMSMVSVAAASQRKASVLLNEWRTAGSANRCQSSTPPTAVAGKPLAARGVARGVLGMAPLLSCAETFPFPFPFPRRWVPENKSSKGLEPNIMLFVSVAEGRPSGRDPLSGGERG